MKWANLIPWSSKQQGQPDRENAWLSPVDEFHSEVNRMFDRFFSDEMQPSLPSGWNAWQGWAPALDVSETDNDVTIRAEIPGVDPKELDVSVTGEMLTISGQKKETSEKNEKGCFHSECRYGSFRRSVPLPAAVDPENVDATYKDGVVTIRLHKAPDASTKRIPVKT